MQPARIPGGRALGWSAGPTDTHVDWYTGWLWKTPGGDWIDRTGVRQGTTPWAAVTTLAGPQALPVPYTMDVTEVLKRVQTDERWCAFRLVAAKAYRKIGGRWGDPAHVPRLKVRYTDGTEAELSLVITSPVAPGLPKSTEKTLALPAFIEFTRPTKPVQSASLQLTCTSHSSGVAELRVYLLDPPVNQDPVQQGLAAKAGKLDAGIEAVPGIIGAQRHLDGSSLSDFVMPGSQVNTWASREFDPALWGGTPDKTKLPHRGLGKFITTNGENWAQLVESSFKGDAFAPLAPGVAALRIDMPAQSSKDGDVVGYGGTGGANASIFMPEPLFGRLPRIFVRYYLRIGTPEGTQYVRDPSKRLHVYCGGPGSDPKWTDWAGKFGITPDHTTSYGSGSGSSGGGRGWQMRLAWSDCDGGVDGPNEGGIRPGFHLYDFYTFQPPGHNYSGDNGSKIYWGQRGGLGGMLYANRWYCVETELKLNTMLDTAPGYVADGELRSWIDGRLAFERKGMVFRTKPIYAPALSATRMAPVRDLGVRGLWLNWYHGGVTQNSVPRTMFVSGLAYGTDYIGPMKF
jgi:hypothetical protein